MVIGSFIMTCTCSCIMSHAEFFGETSNHPGDSAPLQPRFGTLWLLAFPKTKNTFEREQISDHQWDPGKYDGATDSNWENCVRSQGAYFEGDWGIIFLCTMFLVSCIFFNKCLYFSCYMLDTFWTDLMVQRKKRTVSNIYFRLLLGFNCFLLEIICLPGWDTLRRLASHPNKVMLCYVIFGFCLQVVH